MKLRILAEAEEELWQSALWYDDRYPFLAQKGEPRNTRKKTGNSVTLTCLLRGVTIHQTRDMIRSKRPLSERFPPCSIPCVPWFNLCLDHWEDAGKPCCS